MWWDKDRAARKEARTACAVWAADFPIDILRSDRMNTTIFVIVFLRLGEEDD